MICIKADIPKELNEIDDELMRIQQGIETPDDNYVETLKKKRLFYKDEMYFMILKYKRKQNLKDIKKEKKRLENQNK